MADNLRYAIGIDLGGTFVKYSIVASDGSMLLYDKLPARAQESAEAVIEQITNAVNICIDTATEKEIKLEGIGIGTPGIISEDGRTVLGGAENIKGWSNVPLSDILENKVGLTTKMNNDANLMALAETRFGAAKGFTDVVFLTVGTGIGGGVLISGKLYGGYRNRGMELGHITIKYDGEQCACGNIGCLEHYASTGALVRRYVERCKKTGTDCGETNGEEIVALYKKGVPMAVEAMNEHWEFLGHGIGSIINIFSPQKIVIGGGICESGDFYIDEIRKSSLKYALKQSAIETDFKAATLGNKAGCLGAAAQIFM